METQKFKTNIKCRGCIATVTPFLEKTKEISSWSVDTTTADKVLTVEGPVEAKSIVSVLAEAGFQAELI